MPIPIPRSKSHNLCAEELVDGGIDALAESEILPINPPPISGDFTVARDLRFQVTMDELRNSIGRPGIAILDVREPREYAG